MQSYSTPLERLFTEMDRDRRDDLGFLDIEHTPVVRVETILNKPVAWVLGAPWIGKSTVAGAIARWLRGEPKVLGGIDLRYCLTRLGSVDAEQTLPPSWWRPWCEPQQPQPAVWLIDGVEEALGANAHLLERIVEILDAVPPTHLSSLHLILFSRPHSELRGFRQAVQNRYAHICLNGPSEFWLAPFHRDAAEQFVGPDRFSQVLDVIERNDVKAVSGYPIVLRYLRDYREMTALHIRDVWRGILTALLGERSTNPRARARFCTESDERFDAACRIAAVLTLTGQQTIREYSPDPTVPTIGTLFQHPNNRLLVAAREACESGVFIALPEQGAYRFTRRNVQDWLSAFALERLPLSNLATALAGPDGTLAARLSEPARLINAIAERGDVRTEIERLSGGVLLPSDAASPSLPEAIRLLDRLEELAHSAPWGVRLGYGRHEEFACLGVDGFESVLVERLRDPARPRQVKQLLIEVATATRAMELVDLAVAIVCDAEEDSEVRYDASRFIARLGGDAHLRVLEQAIVLKDSHEDVDHRMQALLISKLLDRKLWTVGRAAIYAPPEHTDVIDHRSSLLHRLSERLTLDDAREVLPYLPKLYERHAHEDHPHRLPEFLDRVIDLVTEQNPPQPEDVEKLVEGALALVNDESAHHTARGIARRLRDFPAARRRFYEHDIEAEGQVSRQLGALWLLAPDDWLWLRDQALGRWVRMPRVWKHAYWMARAAHEEGRLTNTKWDEFVELAEVHVPGLPDTVEEAQRQQELERQQREAAQRKREEHDPTRRPLSERVTDILEHASFSDEDRMWRLGLLCFGQSVGIEHQAPGEWVDLSVELRHQVLDACRRGLESAQPTPIPIEPRFPRRILGEGTAFSSVALSVEHEDWLSEGMIRRWLPSALFAQSSGTWAELLRTCWEKSVAATESVLLKTVKEEPQRGEQPVALRMIPSECWTDIMTDTLVCLLENDATRPRGRRELLEQLVTRCPERADAIADEWARQAMVTDDTDHLRQGGRNILINRNPVAAIDIIEGDFAVRGNAALQELHVLWGWRDEFHVRWEQWPLELLERLGRLLVQAYPRRDDPETRSGGSTPQQELRDIRDQLIALLLRRPDREAQAIVDRLGKIDPAVAEWTANHRANEQASQLVPSFDPLRVAVAGALSLPEAVKTLDRAQYRIIRSEDDLLNVVMEVLREVNADVGHDLSMLYQKPQREEDQPAGEHQKLREHLQEDALQAYVRRRLHDLLPRIVDEIEVQICREDQIGRRQRLDLRVIAPCHQSRRLATVVIEVKWSTNDETRSALRQQLGDRYLRREALMHGVFLVGWTGKWRPGDGTGVNGSREQLEEYLKRQRDEYTQAGQPGAGLRIEPFLLDVRWRESMK